jgi:hypothetical protein
VARRLLASGAWAYERVATHLLEDDLWLRRAALALLERGRPAGWTDAFDAALLRERDPFVRQALVESLVGVLTAIWRDEREPFALRRAALEGLACLGHPAAREAVADPHLCDDLRERLRLALERR